MFEESNLKSGELCLDMKEDKNCKNDVELLIAPLAKIDLDDWRELIDDINESCCIDDNGNGGSSCCMNKNDVDVVLFDDNDLDKRLCQSLEDLVNLFDVSVKKCLDNYKDIDIGKLAPVQVRTEQDIMNDSQIWYTLTGTFGDILPIDWSKSLVNKHYKDSLGIKDSSNEDSDNCSNEFMMTNSDIDFNDDYNEDSQEYDEDELREQLDMHSMIISKSPNDEPLFTAEQVLSEIECMMQQQDECYDELTPDSGCFSELTYDLFDMNSYVKYINTFEKHQSNINNNNNNNNFESNNNNNNCNNSSSSSSTSSSSSSNSNNNNNSNNSSNSDTDDESQNQFIKHDLKHLSVFCLNEVIEQLEFNIKELSEILIEDLALRDELEFEKETKNTFITLLLSIDNKRRTIISSETTNKKKKRHSLEIGNEPGSHLSTLIPYNENIKLNVQNLQILNKLLRAINDDSPQVPELLTNYILTVVCPSC